MFSFAHFAYVCQTFQFLIYETLFKFMKDLIFLL